MINLRFTPMTAARAQQLVRWRYDPPYDPYNVPAGDPHDQIRSLIDPANAYFAVLHDHVDLIGFRCSGPDARVSGGTCDDHALDTGGGLRTAYQDAVLVQAFSKRAWTSDAARSIRPPFASPLRRSTSAPFGYVDRRDLRKHNASRVPAIRDHLQY